MCTFYEIKSPKWKQPLNISEKGFFINRSKNLIALPNFYTRHLGVKITGPYCSQLGGACMDKAGLRYTPLIHGVGQPTDTLQRHNTENSKQIFPRKGTARLQSQFLHSCFLWAIYIFLWSVCLFCWRKIGGWPNVGLYVDCSQTHEMWKFGLRPRDSFSGIHKFKFLCNVRIYISGVVSCTYYGFYSFSIYSAECTQVKASMVLKKQ